MTGAISTKRRPPDHKKQKKMLPVTPICWIPVNGYDSPNDPVFFLLHANIDRLWCQWQELHPRQYHHLPLQNTPLSAACTNMLQFHALAQGSHVFDTMLDLRFTPRPFDMLNMRALGYQYDVNGCLGPCDYDPGHEYAGLTESQVWIRHEI